MSARAVLATLFDALTDDETAFAETAAFAKNGPFG